MEIDRYAGRMDRQKTDRQTEGSDRQEGFFDTNLLFY